MVELHTIDCPYCGEPFETSIDASGGSQEYIEDCAVCCQPILFNLVTDDEGNFVSLETRREND